MDVTVSGRVAGRMNHYRLLVAEFILDGYDAKVQGGEEFTDRVYAISYDDGPFEVQFVTRTKQPGIVLTKGDETILIATTEREGAERLLDDALAEVESYGG